MEYLTAIEVSELQSKIQMFCICLGKDVALFVEKHFADEMVKLESYKAKKYKKAFEEVFLKMDEMMLTREGEDELLEI